MSRAHRDTAKTTKARAVAPALQPARFNGSAGCRGVKARLADRGGRGTVGGGGVEGGEDEGALTRHLPTRTHGRREVAGAWLDTCRGERHGSSAPGDTVQATRHSSSQTVGLLGGMR